MLLVTVILSAFLTRREKIELQKKMNMVIGAFFSESGIHLLKSLKDFDMKTAQVGDVMRVSARWSAKDFAGAMRFVKSQDYAIDSRAANLQTLKDLLLGQRAFMLGLLENPNLLEHESFTELLWAVFHLAEEALTTVNRSTVSRPPTTNTSPATSGAPMPCFSTNGWPT